MSDFESEHDTDSETEETKREKPVSPSKDCQDSKLLDYYNDISNVDEGSNSLLTDLQKKAGLAQKTQVKKPELEPWQVYLEEGQSAQSYTYKDENDGTVYEWDEEKRAWFPKIDEDFIAAYQASYGFTESGEPLPPEKILENSKPDAASEQVKDENKDKGQKRKADDQGWFEIDPEKNHNVYVSGLPSDITEEEFVELMSKYGIIMQDADTQKMKVKLYRDKEGNVKGDGRCCYLRGESVSLVLQLLDETDYKGNIVHVERAVFEQKGQYNPSLKPRKKKKKKKKQGQEKLLDWVDRDNKRSKFDRIVILKNVFNSKDFERDPKLIIDLQDDLRKECEKFGFVKKVLIFDRNPDGVCSILFKEPEMSDECVTALNGRWYAGLKMSAELYDGKTNYQVVETDEEMKRRLTEWEEFLAHGDDDNKVKHDEKEVSK
eukprot:gene200-814_t